MRSPIPPDHILKYLAVELGSHLTFHSIERLFRNVAYDIETGVPLQENLIPWATSVTTDLRLAMTDPVGAWLPIDTAPRDGSLILALWCTDARPKPLIVQWDESEGWWYEHPTWTRAAWEPGPSHWSSLPTWNKASEVEAIEKAGLVKAIEKAGLV